MSNLKFVMLVNLVIQVVFILCVAALAIHFNRPAVLWWWLLLPFICFTWSSNGNGDSK